MLTPATISSELRDGRRVVRLAGHWTLAVLAESLNGLEQQLAELAAAGVDWDLEAVERLDSAGALLIWRGWGRRWPATAAMPAAHRHVLERAASVPHPGPRALAARHDGFTHWLGAITLRAGRHVRDATAMVGQLVLDLFWLCAHPREIPLREFSATVYKSGALALPVTALVGFLIGVVVSYLSSLQLKLFGAEVFIVNIIGMSVIRELGPVLVAVLVAGRSGSAMTAQIGVMRVTEEIDALATMGVSRSLRLVLPKVLALALAMPLLVVWCSAAAIFGGLFAAHLQLDLSWGFFIDTLPRVVPLPNLWIGLAKGFVFGLLIGLIACHFGLRVKPNTESLSTKTTSSVVASITVVILADAVFAIMTRNVGLPL
ncbi:ABC transporter permease [Azospira restricta]|uniref:ABC transporter permease n=1 Tax=Azospira restricta TaxID=404405 RepID=A0A974PW02_9RHOO|nr:ABC transporter permease [Azospira restricta]QRJ62504.1 ABC transporter permease [Azospira restricta]